MDTYMVPLIYALLRPQSRAYATHIQAHTLLYAKDKTNEQHTHTKLHPAPGCALHAYVQPTKNTAHKHHIIYETPSQVSRCVCRVYLFTYFRSSARRARVLVCRSQTGGIFNRAGTGRPNRVHCAREAHAALARCRPE